MNSLKQAVNELATAALESEGQPSAETAAAVSKLACHLFKRCVNTLLASATVIGTGKVAALKAFLQRERFWVATFGITADLALASVLPEGVSVPDISSAKGLFRGCAYDMWHAARWALPCERRALGSCHDHQMLEVVLCGTQAYQGGSHT